MKLAAWLRQKGVRRGEFARRIGVSPATVTALCNGDESWMSRITASAIVRETNGEVSPNDFLADRSLDGARMAPPALATGGPAS